MSDQQVMILKNRQTGGSIFMTKEFYDKMQSLKEKALLEAIWGRSKPVGKKKRIRRKMKKSFGKL